MNLSQLQSRNVFSITNDCIVDLGSSEHMLANDLKTRSGGIVVQGIYKRLAVL